MDQSHLAKNNQLNIKAILLPILASVILLAAKIYAYFITDSLIILSSLLDSLMDFIASSLNMAAVIYAAKPPDDDHPYGHNSIEDIVGLVQASFIATTAFLLIYKAFNNIIEPKIVSHSIVGAWVMIFSLAVSVLVVIYQKRIIKKTASVVVESDMLHYFSDILVNAVIILSLFLISNPNLQILDPIFAGLIGIYVAWSAFKIGRRSFNNLMDKELEEDEQNKIKDLIKQKLQIKGYHALKTRRSGNRVFVQIHVELDGTLTLNEAHNIIDNLEKEIGKMWLESDVIIHTDPV